MRKPLNPQEGLEARVDPTKASDLAKRVIHMVNDKSLPFKRTDAYPDSVIPENMEKADPDHILYTFFTTFLDYRVDSHMMYQEFRKFAGKRGNIRKLLGTNKSALEKVLKENFPKSIGNSEKNKRVPKIVEALIFNSGLLEKYYDNNPANIAVGSEVDATQRTIAGFSLFGLPKAALLIKNYVRFGVWPYSPYEIPIKIDRHAFRICLGSEVIEFYKDGEKVPYTKLEKTVGRIHRAPFVVPLMKAFQRITTEEKISAVDLNDSLWFIGSYLCRRNNKVYCDSMCELGCLTRPKSESSGTYYWPGTENRKNVRNLFNLD